MHLRYLAVVRHGDYEHTPGQFLTTEGRDQMKRLGENLKRSLYHFSTKILSSPEMRAIRSAWMLGEALDAVFARSTATSPLLFSKDEVNDARLEEIWALIERESEKHEGIILVTHLEICKSFPKFVLRKRYQEPPPSLRKCGYGEGILIDLRKGFARNAVQFV